MATSNGTGAPARLNPPQERSQKGEKRAGAVGRNARKATRPDCADRVPETVAAALRDELLISFEHNRVEFTGSAQLLIDEGILPAGFAFPRQLRPNRRRRTGLYLLMTNALRNTPSGNLSREADSWLRAMTRDELRRFCDALQELQASVQSGPTLEAADSTVAATTTRRHTP